MKECQYHFEYEVSDPTVDSYAEFYEEDEVEDEGHSARAVRLCYHCIKDAEIDELNS